MGASQSTESATDRQLKEVGPFALRSSEKSALNVLSKIVHGLITKNNLFDLEKLLSSPEKCNDLFIVVSSTVKKEFQLLKFPDPRNPSHMATLSFLQKSSYPPAYPDSVAARDRACNEITHFLIRLVTLSAACTASISRNENIAADLLSVVSTESNVPDISKLVRDLPSNIVFNIGPVDAASLEFLGAVFRPIDKENRPNLYRFGNTSTYMVDVKKGVVYNARSEDYKTPVFKISMELLKDKRNIADFNRPAAAAPAYPFTFALQPAQVPVAPAPMNRMPSAAPAPAPLPAPIAPVPVPAPGASGSVISYAAPTEATSIPASSGLTQFGLAKGGYKRKTRAQRHRRRHVRKTRRMRGGAKDYVKCTLEEVPYGEYRVCEAESICKKLVFIIDAEGNTYDYPAFEQFQSNASRAIPPPKEFGERVKPIFDSILSQKITTVPYRERTELTKDRYKSISGATAETLATFKDYAATMEELETGSAPAPYRAFMLASRLAGPELTTSFCKDKWADQFTTATLAYSLLQALYDDGVAGTAPSPRAADACKAMAKQFTGAQVAIPAAQTGSDVDTFRNIKFSPIPSSLDTFCGEAYPQRTANPSDKSVLIATQRDLRKLYDAHIANMVGIMKKVLFLTSDPAVPGSILFNLNERFMNDPEGGMVALEKIIEEARTLIGNHYLAVEKKYVAALLQMARYRRGVTAVNNPEIASNVLKEVSASLPE
jgi:hypothetical protein